MGDLPIFTTVLNGVAMIFNSSLFDPAQGAGVVLMGLLLAIIYMIMPVLSEGKIDAKPFFFILLLLYAGVIPKERLQVEDVFSGQVTAVDNMPLVIALPASIAASLNKGITDKIETYFSTTNGSYLTMGAEGFVNPLKLLLSLRDPETTIRSFPFLSSSITEFVKYCAPTDPIFSTAKMSASNDIIGYLSGLNVAGIMTYFDAANQNGQGISCTEGKTRLVADSSQVALKPKFEAQAKAATAGEYPKSGNAATLGPTVTGLNQAHTLLLATGIAGNLQTSQQFMANLLAFTPAQQGVDCINQPTGPSMSTCLTETITRQALESNAIDNAGQAGVFTRTVIPASNIMLALFYALSPIVIAVAFLSGAKHGMKVMMGFLIFGIGTQSWMPVAAIINFYIQQQTQYAMSSFPPEGVTMENYMQFYNVVSTKVGLASNLMVSVQAISFALMSGSMYSLSGVSSSMAAKDKVDETMAAPSYGKTDPMVHMGGALDQGYRSTMHSVGGGLVNQPGSTFMNRGDVSSFQTFKSGGDTGQSRQQAETYANQASIKENETFGHGLQATYGKTFSETEYSKLAKSMENSHSTQMDAARDYVNSNAYSKGWSKDTKEKVAAQIAARLSVKPPGPIGQGAMGAITAGAAQAVWETHGPEGFGSAPHSPLVNNIAAGGAAAAGGAVAASGIGTATLDTQVLAERSSTTASLEDFKKSVTNSDSERTSSSNKLATAFSHGMGRDLQTAVAKTFAKDDRHAFAKAHEHAETAQHALSAARNRQSVFGASFQMQSNELAASIQNHGKAGTMINDAVSQLDLNQQRAYHDKVNAGFELLERQGYNMQSNPEAFMAKQLEALYGSSKSGEDAVMEIAASTGASATSSASGHLAGDKNYDTLMEDGENTAGHVKKATKDTGLRAAVAESNSGPAHTVNPKEVQSAVTMAKVETNPEQTVRKQSVSNLPK